MKCVASFPSTSRLSVNYSARICHHNTEIARNTCLVITPLAVHLQSAVAVRRGLAVRTMRRRRKAMCARWQAAGAGQVYERCFVVVSIPDQQRAVGTTISEPIITTGERDRNV